MSTPSLSSSPAPIPTPNFGDSSSACIARQPILTVEQEVMGYELLFRENSAEDRCSSDLESATGTTIDTLNTVGVDVLCDGRKAFLNCTSKMLMKESLLLLRPDEIVIELQHNLPADDTIVRECERLKGLGYKFALDNFDDFDPREKLVPFADFIKIDVRNVRSDVYPRIIERHRSQNRQMVALKVESTQSFIAAQKSGFTLFQGYFFRHPELMKARRIPGNQATYLQLLQAISKPDANFNEIEDLIKREPSLCYRLLRYLNSPALGMSSPINSIRQALNLLGERELYRWVRMATTLVMGQHRPSDLVLASLVRARFCESIAQKVKQNEAEMFLMGMLSLMDAILEVPIGVVVEEISLDASTRAQLLCGKTGEKTKLSPIYDLMVARELGDWHTVTTLGKQLNLSLYGVNKAYNDAMKWARDVTAAGQP